MAGAIRWASAVFLFVLSVAATATTARTQAGAGPATGADTLTATVRYVHPEPGGIDVIRGFHLALQLQYFVITDETRIEREGESMEMEELEAGDLVRIEYRVTERGRIADSIVVVRRSEEGGVS